MKKLIKITKEILMERTSYFYILLNKHYAMLYRVQLSKTNEKCAHEGYNACYTSTLRYKIQQRKNENLIERMTKMLYEVNLQIKIRRSRVCPKVRVYLCVNRILT